MTQNLNLPIEVLNSGILPLAKLNTYFAYPNQGTLRQLIFHAKRKDTYGVMKFVTKIAGRVYIKIPEFLNWLESQGQNA